LKINIWNTFNIECSMAVRKEKPAFKIMFSSILYKFLWSWFYWIRFQSLHYCVIFLKYAWIGCDFKHFLYPLLIIYFLNKYIKRLYKKYLNCQFVYWYVLFYFKLNVFINYSFFSFDQISTAFVFLYKLVLIELGDVFFFFFFFV